MTVYFVNKVCAQQRTRQDKTRQCIYLYHLDLQVLSIKGKKSKTVGLQKIVVQAI